MRINDYIKNKAIPYALAIGIGASLFTGCKETKTELSDILHEDAIVSDVVYSPSRHGSDVSPTIDITGDGGIGIAIVDVDIPEKYAIVFKCEHGKFIVEGTDIEHKALWERLEEGQKVDVTYKEIYKSVYDDVDGDGENDLVSKTLIKYDFLDAQPK